LSFNIKKSFLYSQMIYIFLLLLSAGAVLVLGILVAPVIFGSEKYFGEELLVRAQEGILMGTIFLSFSKWLGIFSIIIVIFESYEYKSMRRDKIALTSSFLAISSALLFYAYYAPSIMEMNTMNESFNSLHKGSEINAKIMTFAFLVLAWRRILLLRLNT